VPNKELEYKQFSTFAFKSYTSTIAHLLADSAMDINDFVDTSNIIRERTKFLDKVTSRSSSIFSTVSSIDYYYRIEMNNLFTNKDIRDSINSLQLSYKDIDNSYGRNQVSRATNSIFPKNPNIFQMRHWPLIPAMSLMLIMMTLSTSNYCMTSISLQNLNYRIVTFVISLFIVL